MDGYGGTASGGFNRIYKLCNVIDDIVLIGHMAAHFRYQGSGSSHINPTKQVNLTDVMPDVSYVACCDEKGEVTEESLQTAAETARKYKIVVVVAGLPDAYESEGFDREHMKLPEGHNRMIEAVAAVNPNTVVVLLGGSAMELPWADRVKAILYMGLPGQAGGEAALNLLTGRVNPSGKLTETWPYTYEDVVSKETTADVIATHVQRMGIENMQYGYSAAVGLFNSIVGTALLLISNYASKKLAETSIV